MRIDYTGSWSPSQASVLTWTSLCLVLMAKYSLTTELIVLRRSFVTWMGRFQTKRTEETMWRTRATKSSPSKTTSSSKSQERLPTSKYCSPSKSRKMLYFMDLCLSLKKGALSRSSQESAPSASSTNSMMKLVKLADQEQRRPSRWPLTVKRAMRMPYVSVATAHIPFLAICVCIIKLTSLSAALIVKLAVE